MNFGLQKKRKAESAVKIRVIAFTAKGRLLAVRLTEGLRALGQEAAAYAKQGEDGLAESGPLSEWTKAAFSDADGIIFVGACGIAVRACAPYVQDKFHDPAVIVIDDCAKFCISLLSGHVGGANRLALEAAEICGATPVVTTATDVNGRFAVDVWAKENGLQIADRAAAKKISSVLLEGGSVGACTRFGGEIPLPSPLPDGVEERESGEVGFCVTLDETDSPFRETLHLVPRRVILGIGCRKDTPPEMLETAVRKALEEEKISLRAVQAVCSVDLKAREKALLMFCEKYSLPFTTYSSERLANLEGDFSASEFVKKITGVENVCERAAMAGGGERLLFRKKKYPSVTVAASWSRKK